MKIKKVISVILIFVTLSALLSLCACGSQHTRYTKTYFDYFDTVIELVGYTEEHARFEAVAKKAERLIAAHHELFDIYNTYDGVCNLATVNRSAGQQKRVFTIEKELAELLGYSKEIYELTGGKVNAAMGSVLSLWHESRENGLADPESAKLPDESALLAAAEHTDIDAFSVQKTADAYVLEINDPLLTFDAGALAKGYTAKKVTELLRLLCDEQSKESYMLNFGGMVCPIGAKPSGEAWVAGVEYPKRTASDGYLCVAELSGGALVTSAANIREYTVNGVSYGHIIDADTLYPPTFHASVSVYCDDPALGDALSTALFCMSEQDGRELIASLFESGRGVSAMWVHHDMTYSYTEAFSVIIKK